MSYVPHRGDLVWLSFDPQAGHEQAGRRPAFVLAPEAYNRKGGRAAGVSGDFPVGSKWSDSRVLKVLDDVTAHYAVDTNRIYLTGLSMGGFGVVSPA